MMIPSPSINDFQFFGDGKRIIFLTRDGTEQELMMIYDNVIITEMTTTIGFETPLFPSGTAPFAVPQPVDTTIRFLTQSQDYQIINDKNLLFKTDLFKHMTITDLLKEVNKKANLRKR